MEKRKLSAIPREEASTEIVELAHQLTDIEIIATAKLVENKKILLLNFYKTANLKKGNTKAVLRTFMSADDYITQDLTKSNISWKTAAFDRLEGLIEQYYGWNYDLAKRIHIHQGFELMKEFFKEYVEDTDRYIWSAVSRYQGKVKARRLAEKHRKETDAIDKLMEMVEEPPQDFFRWANEEALSHSRYLVYQEFTKGNARCSCTHCGNTSLVDRKKVRLRHNEKGLCPMCGSNVTFKAKGKLPKYGFVDEKWVAYIQPTEKGFCWRYFHFERKYGFGCSSVTNNHVELSRTFWDFTDKEPKYNSYEFRPYKNGATRWSPDKGVIMCGLCCLYPGNLPQAWEHTPMRYSGLEYLARSAPTLEAHYEWGIRKYMEFPQLEWICKMGINKLAAEIVGESRYHRSNINYNGKTIYDILGINKVNTRVLQAIQGGMEELRLLQVAENVGYQFKPDELKRYYETFGCNTELISEANRKVTLHKIIRYIEKESEKYPKPQNYSICWRNAYYNTEKMDPRIERKQNMAKDWIEYLEWCEQLKYDTDKMFIYMPNNFRKVHNRTAKDYQALRDKIAAAEKRRQEKLIQKKQLQIKQLVGDIFKQNEKADAFSIKGSGLVIVVPKGSADIRNEGTILHHCVGTYIDKVARGETSIFFIRREEEPGTPYYTLEWKNNKIEQCRGRHNCAMTKEVEAFTKVFEKKMLQGLEKQTA